MDFNTIMNKTMIRQRDKPQQLTREISINLKGHDADSRRVTLSFSSEEPYRRFFGAEILDHNEGTVNLDRLQNIGCVLFNHNRDYVIAKIISANIVNSRGEAEIEFDTDDLSEKIYQKVISGTLKGVSVGYLVYNYDEVKAGKKSEDGRFEGPCFVATDWEPFEISIVSVPADPTVGVGREIEAAQARQKSAEEMANFRYMIQLNKNYLKLGGK